MKTVSPIRGALAAAAVSIPLAVVGCDGSDTTTSETSVDQPEVTNEILTLNPCEGVDDTLSISANGLLLTDRGSAVVEDIPGCTRNINLGTGLYSFDAADVLFEDDTTLNGTLSTNKRTNLLLDGRQSAEDLTFNYMGRIAGTNFSGNNLVVNQTDTLSVDFLDGDNPWVQADSIIVDTEISSDNGTFLTPPDGDFRAYVMAGGSVQSGHISFFKQRTSEHEVLPGRILGGTFSANTIDGDAYLGRDVDAEADTIDAGVIDGANLRAYSTSDSYIKGAYATKDSELNTIRLKLDAIECGISLTNEFGFSNVLYLEINGVEYDPESQGWSCYDDISDYYHDVGYPGF